MFIWLTRVRGRAAGGLEGGCSPFLVGETCPAHTSPTHTQTHVLRHTLSDTLRKQQLSKSTEEHAPSTHQGKPKTTLATHGESTKSTMSVPQRMKRIEQKQEPATHPKYTIPSNPHPTCPPFRQ